MQFFLQLVNVTNGNTLVISLAEESDAGNYSCQVSTYVPIEVKHSVKIRGKSLHAFSPSKCREWKL